MNKFMQLVSSHLHTIPIYQPGRSTQEIKRLYHLDHVVKLASNENPLGPSPKVIKHLKTYLPEISRYPEDSAPNLMAQLSQMHAVNSDNIVLGAGSSEVLQLISQAFLDEQSELIISQYAFILYKILAKAHNARVIEIPVKKWQVDLALFLQAITDKTHLIMLANPNNPTGSWSNYETLKAFIAKVPSHVVVVVDEAYQAYMAAEDGYQSAVGLIKQFPNLIVTHTFSKVYGLAGLRVGYCIASQQVAQLLKRLKKPFSVSNVALEAAYHALLDQQHLEQSLVVNKTGQQQLLGAFNAMKIPIIGYAGNFITIHIAEKAMYYAQQLLEQGVIIRTLKPYAMQDYLRISIGTAEENEIFINKLKRYYDPPK